ncbi:Phosphoserine transaminase [Microbotryomycetes sp. JL221]|nr:Phosphoserine transaminase [Microbotryomycetes sp. JL221]
MATMDDRVKERETTINMNAGPSPLPTPALIEAAQALLSFPATPGMGIAEISHRSKPFEQVLHEANANLRSLLQVPDNYKILWMQGGGLTQFATTVLNLVAAYRIKHKLSANDDVVADYAVTGSWSSKAANEATRLGLRVNKVVDGKKLGNGKFNTILDASQWQWTNPNDDATHRKPAFVYYCDNETVDGIEFASKGAKAFPLDDVDKDVPIVCDMSSNFLSRPVDVAKYGVIYAGAQKNLGPAGATVIIVREDLIVDLDEAVQYGGARVPSMLSYKNMADNDSMYNTPPTFTIYVCGLVLKSLLDSPPLPRATNDKPLEPLSAFANKKSSLVYDQLDSSFYSGTADKSVRSRMNPTFRIKGGEESLEKKFVTEASERGIKGVNGHRSVGGIRTSIYNAVTLDHVMKLVEFMKEFKARNQ